jgi:hypothetical protein
MPSRRFGWRLASSQPLQWSITAQIPLSGPSVDVNGELAKLDPDGYRPLRAITATEQVHP